LGFVFGHDLGHEVESLGVVGLVEGAHFLREGVLVGHRQLLSALHGYAAHLCAVVAAKHVTS
jgi:hypothetical protein